MPFNSLVIYVDDDDPVVEQTLLEFLTDLGHTAIGCRSFTDVQDKLAMADPPPDAVITDVVELDIDAIKQLQQTHQEHPKVEFMLISNGGRDLSGPEAVSCGVYAFLREPLRLTELELYLTRL